MDIIRGFDALQKAEEATRLGGDFALAFYSYSRTKGSVSTELRTYSGCTVRAQMPHEKWSVDGKHLFLFDDADGRHRMCWRILIRYIGFKADNYKLHKVIWYE